MTAGAVPARVLLERIQTRAEGSPEIVGLLLFGSLAAGTEDVHSDLDIGLYVDDAAYAAFDLRRWLEPVAEVAAIYVDPDCSTVIFADLTRVEVHLGPSGRPSPHGRRSPASLPIRASSGRFCSTGPASSPRPSRH